MSTDVYLTYSLSTRAVYLLLLYYTDCGTGCQSGPCGTGGGGNYNYCGTTWGDANTQCGATCYDGLDMSCPAGTFCFADATACPLVTGPGPTPPPAPPTPPPTRNPVTPYPTRNPVVGGPPAVAGGDSRVIAYVANWETCPTPQQLDGYTHIIIAFAVSYSYSASKNLCSANCNISTPTVPICAGQTGNEVSQWKAAGKKVILSFGGAGMGGSWNGDVNDCWDYCFEKEEQLSTDIVNIVSNQGFDGVDLDYEYCYDTENNRHGRNCNNSSTGKYSDAKAKYFLEEMTILLRQKLDTIGSDMELTHAPMDSDLVTDSPYFQILARQNGIINFLMPQVSSVFIGHTRLYYTYQLIVLI